MPSSIRRLAVDQKHPYYNPKYLRDDYVVLVNGDPQTNVVVIDVDNGYVRIAVVNRTGPTSTEMATETVGRASRMKTFRRKGKVEVYTYA